MRKTILNGKVEVFLLEDGKMQQFWLCCQNRLINTQNCKWDEYIDTIFKSPLYFHLPPLQPDSAKEKKRFCRGLFVTSKHKCRTNLLFLSRENCSAISGNYALQTPLGLLYMPITPVVKFQFDLGAAGSATCNKKPFLFSSQQRLLLQPWVLPNWEDTEICKVPGEEQQK